MQLDEFRPWFDERFLVVVKERTRRYRTFTQRDEIHAAIEQVEALARGGKRVRPYLAYLSYIAAGGQHAEDIVKALCAIELFHVFCLVHDDIIDEDELRRGVSTVHAVAREMYATHGRASIAPRAGNAQGILVGDLVFSWVFELIASHMGNDAFCKEFMYTIDEVVIGQMIDVDLMARPKATREMILEKMRLKTAGYTFVQPLRIGRLLAGIEGRNEALDALGLSLGLAFQMQDDLLDIYAEEAELGKDIGSDIEESQHTLLTQHVVDCGTPDDIRELQVLIGQAVDDDRLHLLRALFERTGAAQALRKDIQSELDYAQSLAGQLDWPAESREALLALVRYVASRTS